MAQAFLRDLLQARNRVRDNENQECVICRETAGTMSQTTGLSETAVRTSCGHVVGSGCIAKWLRENNTCPMCRHEFFPAESYFDRDDVIESHSDGGSIFDHGDMREDHQSDHLLPTPRNQILNGSVDDMLEWLGSSKRQCEIYCNRLRLQPGVAQIAHHVCCNLLEPGHSTAEKVADSSDDFVIAVSIYLASHLTRHPKTAEDIARTIGIFDLNICRDINSFFRYNYRDEILDSQLEAALDKSSLETATSDRPAPVTLAAFDKSSLETAAPFNPALDKSSLEPAAPVTLAALDKSSLEPAAPVNPSLVTPSRETPAPDTAVLVKSTPASRSPSPAIPQALETAAPAQSPKDSWEKEGGDEIVDDGIRYELQEVCNIRTLTWPPEESERER